ncbi:MAG: hypothetical protein HDQ93_00005 [Desulfovibrio sp.]|nr:hypothetical protein [Desulfovibrio sp.]
MNAQEIIDYIANSEKKTPSLLHVSVTQAQACDMAATTASQLSISKLIAKPRPTSNAPTPLATRIERKPPAKNFAPAPATREAMPKAPVAAVDAAVEVVAAIWAAEMRNRPPRRPLRPVRTKFRTRPMPRLAVVKTIMPPTASATTFESMGKRFTNAEMTLAIVDIAPAAA